MTEDKNIGTVMNWNEIVANYPNCIVGLLDYNDTIEPIKAKLVYVCRTEEDEEKAIKDLKLKGIKPLWMQTTEPMELNGLWEL